MKARSNYKSGVYTLTATKSGVIKATPKEGGKTVRLMPPDYLEGKIAGDFYVSHDGQKISFLVPQNALLEVKVTEISVMKDIKEQWQNNPPSPKEKFSVRLEVVGNVDRSYPVQIKGNPKGMTLKVDFKSSWEQWFGDDEDGITYVLGNPDRSPRIQLFLSFLHALGLSQIQIPFAERDVILDTLSQQIQANDRMFLVEYEEGWARRFHPDPTQSNTVVEDDDDEVFDALDEEILDDDDDEEIEL